MTSIEGILSIDKPSGLSSHDVVNKVRRVAGMRRIGHTGTLDPLATGLLIICLGRATRLAEYLIGQRKRYEASIRLGQETDTFDAEGTIVDEKPLEVTVSQIRGAMDSFRGEINQVPPAYSAVKIAGQPLYKRARQGEAVTRPERKVTIYEFNLQRWQPPYLEVCIVCSSGTYIRSIAHDLGQALGCGGYLADLRRLAIGNFTIQDALPLQELKPENLDTYLQPIDAAVRHLPHLILDRAEATRLFHGLSIPVRIGQPAEPLVRAYDERGQFVGILTRVEQHWQARKIFYQPSD